MPKPLQYYCSSRKDAHIFKELEAELEILDENDKLICAVIALCASLHGRVYLSVDAVVNGAKFSSVKRLVPQLTPSGCLDLGQALIEQVRP